MAGEPLRGIRLRVSGRDAFEPYLAGVTMVWAVYRLHPERPVCSDAVPAGPTATRLKAITLPGRRPDESFASWQPEVDGFRTRSAPYRRYP